MPSELEAAARHWLEVRTRLLREIESGGNPDWKAPGFDLGAAEWRLATAARALQ